ncbi:WecB/TagA/CpsF family glycosyltransferase [Oscillatoria acuminata]|uniref:Exopolysaccharide biosynthesis protein, WecB/TagA/CpsF family n=1 Tax=Oscillatoria acuminata PCC 6304 TaxID=56110 RepID=K9TIY6_9CYAN|nr:WecB/TagA/CpsF family glycosyltransferase [Oscillatoria acuminata]AFY82520.1 exopolysaccharide biosynthesis protein, WecB/TagA/CpsF family [Oscillatoria acuminata PCC 6304]
MLQVLQKFSVLGLPVHITTHYRDWLQSRLQQRQGTHVVTLNAEMAMQALENLDLAEVIHQADLVIPDGAGVVFYFLVRGRKIQRCPGIELAESLVQLAGDLGEDCSTFFFGGKPGIAEIAAKRWQTELPALAIAGTQDGYLSPEDEPAFKARLQQLQPRLILVGLGVPRQEFWIRENRHLCPDAIWVGVGGSFDIWSGQKERAPVWLQRLQMEWAYRLYQEPWRWRRMLALPHFAWISMKTALRQ